MNGEFNVKFHDKDFIKGTPSQMSTEEFCKAVDESEVCLHFQLPTDYDEESLLKIRIATKNNEVDSLSSLPETNALAERLRFLHACKAKSELEALQNAVNEAALKNPHYHNLLKLVDDTTAQAYEKFVAVCAAKANACNEIQEKISFIKKALSTDEKDAALSYCEKLCDEEPLSPFVWAWLAVVKYRNGVKDVSTEFIKLYKVASLADAKPSSLEEVYAGVFRGKTTKFNAGVNRKWLCFDSGMRNYSLHLFTPLICFFSGILIPLDILLLVLKIRKQFKFKKLKETYNIGYVSGPLDLYYSFDLNGIYPRD